MKKLISLALVLCMLLPSFSVFAIDSVPTDEIIDDVFKFDVGDFAAGNSEATENNDDVTRFNRLVTIGVWDDATKSPNALLTKTEFYVILSKLKFSNSNAFAGIYQYEGNVNKDYTTYLDAYTYLIDMLGYQHEYKVLGEGASSVLIVADRIGLISQNPENAQAFISRAEFAKLVEKAISIDLCEVAYTNDGYRYEVKEGKTLLNTYHNTYDVSGFVNAIKDLAVFGASDLREGYISIDRMTVKGEGIDYSAYYGKLVKAYAVYDEMKNEYNLIHIEEETDTKTVEINFQDIVSVNSYEVTYLKEDGNEYSLSVGGLKNISENGRVLSALSEMSNYKANEGKIIFCESKKYGGIDTAIISKYDYFVVDYNDTLENKIGFKYGMKYNGEGFVSVNPKALNVVKIVGKENQTVKDIPAGSTVKMLSCDATGYKELYVSTTKNTSGVTGIYDDFVEISGKTYRMSKALLARIKECQEDENISYYDRVDMPNVGDVLTAYVIDDVLVGFTKSNEYMYGYLKLFGFERTGIDPAMILKIFTQNGEWVNLTFANKVEFDGVAGMSKEDVQATLDKRRDTDADARREFIRFKLNGDGEISGLDTIWEDPAESDTEDDIKKAPDLPDGTWTGHLSWTMWHMNIDRITNKQCKYFIKTGAKIFVIPEDEEEEDKFKIVGVDQLPKNLTGNPIEISLTMYNPDNYFQCPLIMYRGGLDAGKVSGDESFQFYVQSIMNAVIDVDEQLYGYKISGFKYLQTGNPIKGTGEWLQVSYYLDESTYQKIIERNIDEGYESDFDVNDVLWIVMEDNKISYMCKLQDDITTINSLPLTKIVTRPPGMGDDRTFYVGTIEQIDTVEKLIKVRYGEGENDVDVIYMRIQGVVDANSGKMKICTISDFHEGDKIFASVYSGLGYFMMKLVD